MINFVRI